MDLASRLIAPTMRGAKHEVFDMPTNGSDSSGAAARRCSRCAQPMRLVRKRHGLVDCPTCTRTNAGAVRYHIPRKLAQQDGATLICLVCFASRRGNAALYGVASRAAAVRTFHQL
jgi:hypothetical protein